MRISPRLFGLLCLTPIAARTQTPSAWSVAERPTVLIGDSERDVREQFVRILGVASTGDGSIAILDAAIPALRVFDANGRWVRDLGRRGSGPGEYLDVSGLVARANGVGVLERSGEVEWLRASGQADRGARVALGTARAGRYNVVPAALLPDGGVVMRADERMFGRTRGEYRQGVGLILVHPTGASDTLGWFPGDSGRADARAPYVPRPYLPGTGVLLATGDDRIAVMTADRDRVQIFDGKGRARFSWTAPLGRPERVTEADVERAREDGLRGLIGNDARVVGEWSANRPLLSSGPLATQLLIARGGTAEIWIERLGRPNNRARWLVMSEEGRTLATVLMPPGVELMEVGRDAILGLHRDEDGVERVVRHGLRRR